MTVIYLVLSPVNHLGCTMMRSSNEQLHRTSQHNCNCAWENQVLCIRKPGISRKLQFGMLFNAKIRLAKWRQNHSFSQNNVKIPGFLVPSHLFRHWGQTLLLLSHSHKPKVRFWADFLIQFEVQGNRQIFASVFRSSNVHCFKSYLFPRLQ